jgi:hypothetical protein
MSKPTDKRPAKRPWYPDRQVGKRMSREELIALVTRKDLSPDEVRRLEQERAFAQGKLEVVFFARPEDSQSEQSASATIESINRVLGPLTESGRRSVSGGEKGVVRQWGSAEQRELADRELYESYLRQRSQNPGLTDRALVRSGAISQSKLTRLKRKYRI